MIWTLLVIMQFKHFIADYLLQNDYMKGKFKQEGWQVPLAAHCCVHFFFTFFIALFSLATVSYGLLIAIALGLLDFVLHFIMDRVKVSKNLLGRYNALSKNEYMDMMNHSINPKTGETLESYEQRNQFLKSNQYFWYALGLDQMVHHLTDLLVVFLIFKALGA